MIKRRSPKILFRRTCNGADTVAIDSSYCKNKSFECTKGDLNRYITEDSGIETSMLRQSFKLLCKSNYRKISKQNLLNVRKINIAPNLEKSCNLRFISGFKALEPSR